MIARRNLVAEMEDVSEIVLDPRLVEQIKVISRSDDFWLGLFAKDLTRSLLVDEAAREREVELEGGDEPGEGIRGGHRLEEPVHEGQVGARGRGRGAAGGGDRADIRARASSFELAALLHDIGQLSVPARIMGKPDILTLTEMQLMQRHPSYSRLILEALPGMEEVALWVGGSPRATGRQGLSGDAGDGPDTAGVAHHRRRERIRGADVGQAVSEALRAKDALKVLTGAAGTPARRAAGARVPLAALRCRGDRGTRSTRPRQYLTR